MANGAHIGRGEGVAALFNGRAKQVTPRLVHALQRALPEAMVAVSTDLEQARRQVEELCAHKPWLFLSGGGDGAATHLVNFLRGAGCDPWPTLGILPLGTGNGWARATGAPPFSKIVSELPFLPRPLPTTRFDLVEVEHTLCPFTGVGWDARILNDYIKNLDRRSAQLFGSRIARRLHTGLRGYLYSVVRHTVPGEIREVRAQGWPIAVLEAPDDEAWTLDEQGTLQRVKGPVLYEGPVSIVAAATTPQWGYGFQAFPHARLQPGMINVRVYDRGPIEALRNALRLWRGEQVPGMRDFFARRITARFSRPLPFHRGGDPLGERRTLDFHVCDHAVEVVDWPRAQALGAGGQAST